MTTQIKAGVIAANAITASELASSALSGGTFTGDVTFDTTTLVVDSTNNRVGIGTSSPAVALQVHDSLGTTLDDGVLRLLDDTSYAANVGAALALGFKYNSSGNAIQRGGVIKAIKENATDGNYASALLFGTTANGASTAERMRIDSSGNVGIGVTDPQYALDISGGLQFTGESKLNGGYWLGDSTYGFRINKSDNTINNFIVRDDGLSWNRDDLLVGKSSYSDTGSQNARLDVSHDAACIAQLDTTSANGGYIAISVSDSGKGYIGTGSNIGAANTSDLMVRAVTGDLHFKTDQNGTDAIVELANDTATNIHNGIKIYNSTDRNNYTRYFHIGRRNVSSAGLLAYYDPNNSHCDDNSGSSIIDLSGNGYTLTKASTFTHQSVSARSYWSGDGGANAYAGGSVPLTAYAPIHLSLWVIWEDVNNFNSSYQLNGWQGASAYCYIGGQKEGTSSAAWLYGYVGSATNIPSDQTGGTNRNSTVNSDEWVYLTIQAGWTNSSQGSRAIGRTEVYLNGTLVDSKASQGMMQASATNFFLGKISGGYQLNGAIGPAVVYKRTLTQAEILDNMRVHQELYMI